MTGEVVITGMGIISCLGNGVEANRRALLSGSSGISLPEILLTRHRDLPVGEIKYAHQELIDLAKPTKPHFWSRTALLGLIAAAEALKDLDEESRSDLALINGTTVGGMDRTEHFYPAFMQNESAGRLREVVHHDCGGACELIAGQLGCGGYLTTINTACSSSVNSIMLGARLIKSGQAKRVLAGGTDALSVFTLNGFNSLMILDKALCRPFDAQRQGLNLGEGAAYVLLESADDAAKAGRKVLARVAGYANANDAFHQTASSPEGQGAQIAMRKAIESAGISAENIDYINAHGTATPNNDVTEAAAIDAVFKISPLISSTKSYTGHTLGAAGAIESVFSVIALQEGYCYPNLRLTDKLSEFPLNLPETGVHKALNYVLSNSFGFGGNCSSIIFSAE
jgi:3-oxoacyl-[acyl-carrier-protein] synthase-1